MVVYNIDLTNDHKIKFKINEINYLQIVKWRYKRRQMAVFFYWSGEWLDGECGTLDSRMKSENINIEGQATNRGEKNIES